MILRQCAAAVVLAIVIAAGCGESPPAPEYPDTIYSNAYIYTADPARTTAEAVAVRGDRIVFVGTSELALELAGDDTRIVDLEGRMMVPGLHDIHIHPLGIVPPGGCDLDNRRLTLEQIAATLRECLVDDPLPAGEWLIVQQWNPYEGNEPDANHPSLRAALDAVSTTNPILLQGSDGHHGAANSAALALARSGPENIIGFDKSTLENEFAAYRQYVGVDAGGEPSGAVNETARDLLGLAPGVFRERPAPDAMAAIAAKLASYGITSVLDASTPPDTLDLYRGLADSGRQSFRLTAALNPNFDTFRGADGKIDVVAVVDAMAKIRSEYAGHPLIRADTAKIFVDGVVESDPFSDPPVLGNAALLAPYRQPLFSFDAASRSLNLRGYVDPDGPACQPVLAALERNEAVADPQEFHHTHGFWPTQCVQSKGVLEHPLEFIRAYVQELDARDFNVHAHAIGDRAVRVAVDAFENARAVNGEHPGTQTIAHAQLVHPDDVKRIGKLGVFMAMTYSWIVPLPAYDVTVIPFIDEVRDLEDLYHPEYYSYRNAYPVRSLLLAGAQLAAGSDAPVDSREPRPFVNMQQAVTRADAEGRVWNADETIDIRTVLDAYTVNGARALRQEALTGSIEVGKKADLAVLDHNLIELYESGRGNRIGATQVVLTVFDGEEVFKR